MSYQAYKLHLSKPQMVKLATGDRVRLPHKNLQGEHLVYLTKSQLAKVQKAQKAGKGLDLQMSNAQLKHHKKKGGSVFGDIWQGLKDAGSFAFNKVLLPVATSAFEKRVLPAAQTKLEGLVDKGLTRVGFGKRRRQQLGQGFFDDLWSGIKSVGSKAADVAIPVATNLAIKALTGLGTKKSGSSITLPGGSITLPGGSCRKGRSISLPGQRM